MLFRVEVRPQNHDFRLGIIQKVTELPRGVRGVQRHENRAKSKYRKVQEYRFWRFIDQHHQPLAASEAKLPERSGQPSCQLIEGRIREGSSLRCADKWRFPFFWEAGT